MNTQTSGAGKAAAAAPARAAAKKADAPENKADKAGADKAEDDPEKVKSLTGSTIARDRSGHADLSVRAGAGLVEGKFTCLRELEGDRSYRAGDARDGKVSELAHLAQSGAIAPADKATQEALADFAGVDAKVVKPKKAGKADEEQEA